MKEKPKIISGVIREDDPIPPEMERLRIDSTGRPIPFFVKDHGQGDPDFRIMDGDRWHATVRNRLCWVCGGRMGKIMGMLGGPLIIVSGMGYDPPAHISCSHWSIRNCPFLVNPMRKIREAGIPKSTSQFKGAADTNPGLGALIHHRDAEFTGTEEDMKVRGYNIVEVEFFSRGRPAEAPDVLSLFHKQWMEYRLDNQHLPESYFEERLELANQWLPLEYREEDFLSQS